MTVSFKTINPLAIFLVGDEGVAPYLTGPELVEFFNQCGFNDYYGPGFPSRWKYAAEKLTIANGSDKLEGIIEEFIHPRHYRGETEIVDRIADRINKLIEFDGLALKKRGKVYKVVGTEEKLVFGATVASVDHDFIQDQIAKCQDKIQNEDFSGAITNARSLLEAVMIHVIENIENVEIKNDGNLESLWTRCKKALKISFGKPDIPDFVFQTLSGLDTVVKGLSGISNNVGDRHASKFKAKKHHAKLAVNSSMTLSEYVIDLMDLRKSSA